MNNIEKVTEDGDSIIFRLNKNYYTCSKQAYTCLILKEAKIIPANAQHLVFSVEDSPEMKAAALLRQARTAMMQADSCLSLWAHRYSNTPIPEDLEREVRALVSALRSITEDFKNVFPGVV